MAFAKAARTSGLPPSVRNRCVIPNIVLPHWLRATKLWNTSNTTSLRLKCGPSPAF